jgi:hypothetical protein
MIGEIRMNKMKRVTCLAGFAMMAGTLSQAQLADKKALTLQIAKQVVAAAEQAARRHQERIHPDSETAGGDAD